MLPLQLAPTVRFFKTFKNKPPSKGQKMKVKSSVKKRFRVIGSGKSKSLKYKKAGTRHNLGNKSSKVKRGLKSKVRQ
jgi:ribosomal protein L35